MAKKNVPQAAADFYNELETMMERNQRRMDLRGSRFAERIETAVNRNFKDLQREIVKDIKQLTTDEGEIVDNSNLNTRHVLASKKQWADIIAKVQAKGDKWFLDEGVKMQELTQADFDSYEKLAAKHGIDVSFTLLDEEMFKQAAKQSQLIYDDFTGKLADEIQIGLMRRIMGGVSSEQLIEEYTNIVPAIDKPKKGGGRFKLSAEARARFTFRTEIIRLANQVTNELSKQAFGDNYYIKNFNPMDERTAPVCVAATSAGVMRLKQFMASHGLPPRHVNCRCSIAPVPIDIAVR